MTRLGDREIALLLETTHQLHQQCFRLEFDYKYTINCIRINVNVAHSKDTLLKWQQVKLQNIQDEGKQLIIVSVGASV